jgi:ribonucleoside-triphosphate reductase
VKTAVPAAAFAETQEAAAKAAEAPAAAPAAGETQIFLFKTPTCPNCKVAGALLDRAGISYTALNANEEKELVEKFGVKQAPTLVLVNGGEVEKYRGVSDIKGWLMKK